MSQSILGQNTNAAASAVPKTQLSQLDVELAVAYLKEHYSGSASTGRCARAIRLALEAGGVVLRSHPINAKDYGKTLETSGFVKLKAANYTTKAGDIAVIQPYKGGSTAGHITMYDGAVWRSDFIQNDMWSGPGYRTNKPDHAIYRP